MNLDEIIQAARLARAIPDEDELRALPYKKAFIYGRVSSQGQIRDSHESIMEIAKLVEIALKDGYRTALVGADVEEWLGQIQSGADIPRVLEDGDILIDCRDLGLSGSLSEDKRPGLASLSEQIMSGAVGAVYLTEGMSRLSRDRDRVLGYKLLKLLKEQRCRIRTPEGVYNPAIARDWQNLAEDIEDSADEMKKFGIRLGRRRASKAAEGRHIGSPVSPGYIVSIEGQRRDGSYILGKWQPYPPHKEVVIEALEEVVRQQSIYKAVQMLAARGVTFPFFPEDLQYMETRSSLRFYPKDDSGYIITYNNLKGLALNLKLIGIWQWRDTIIENNHEPVITIELFKRAYEIAHSNKPKGRAAYNEPMEWSELLFCMNHKEPTKLTALNSRQRWICRNPSSPLGPPCLQIADHLLTPPLTAEFLRTLDLTPHARAIMERLKDDVERHSLEEGQRRRRESELKTRIARLKGYLGSDDPHREETYWQLIEETKEQLEILRQNPMLPSATPVDLDRVVDFLDNLDQKWQRYPSRLRNRLISLLIDMVELRHDQSSIEATIVWKVGLRQRINIARPRENLLREMLWTEEEASLLEMLWPSATQETIRAAFPTKSWHAIGHKARRKGLKRLWAKTSSRSAPRWTAEDDDKLRDLYAREASIHKIAEKLGRTVGAVLNRACSLEVARPKELRFRKASPTSESMNIKVFQQSSSRSPR
jgi:DNA invertase Pin-like site-specific DNA recombinase